MFIGEAVGKVEDDLGRPFVGPAGQLLNKILQKMNTPRDSVYIPMWSSAILRMNMVG